MGQASQKKGTNNSGREEVVVQAPSTPFFEQRWVLLSILVASLITAVGVPLLLYDAPKSCDTGDPLIDAACMAQRREAEAIRLGKNKKINIRPKKQPFRVVNENMAGGLSQTSPGDN